MTCNLSSKKPGNNPGCLKFMDLWKRSFGKGCRMGWRMKLWLSSGMRCGLGWVVGWDKPQEKKKLATDYIDDMR